MNGRGALAFFGFSVLLSAVFQAHFRRKISLASSVQIFVGVLFSAASSGTMMTAILTLACAAWFEIARGLYAGLRARISRVTLIFLLAGAVLLAVTGKFILSGIEKNIKFYGDGFDGALALLNHGPGASIYPYVKDLTPSQVAVIGVILTFGISMYLMQRKNALLWHILFCALVAGVFGYLTLSLAIIPILLLTLAIRRQSAASRLVSQRMFTIPQQDGDPI